MHSQNETSNVKQTVTVNSEPQIKIEKEPATIKQEPAAQKLHHKAHADFHKAQDYTLANGSHLEIEVKDHTHSKKADESVHR